MYTQHSLRNKQREQLTELRFYANSAATSEIRPLWYCITATNRVGSIIGIGQLLLTISWKVGQHFIATHCAFHHNITTIMLHYYYY